MAVPDVYLLALHEPYEAPTHPVPINTTIVHAMTLLHSAVPQPDGGMIYRCLTEFPGRSAGCLVPFSTMTFELDGGELWPEIGDWDAVNDAVVDLAREGQCDALHLGLPGLATVLLANSPTTTLHVAGPDGQSVLGPAERAECLRQLEANTQAALTQGAFWPGAPLVDPPATPATLPYKPFES